MAPGHPAEGRALSPAGDGPTRDPERADPAQRKWEESPQEGTGMGARAAGLRVSPDPLQSTDRYRLVTPFKLKL